MIDHGSFESSHASSYKIPTGVPIVDSLLDGGIARGSSILLRGHPLVDVSTMAMQFLYHRLKSGDIGLYFVNNKSPASVVEDSVSIGLSLDEFRSRERLIFVDAYSGLFGMKSEEKYSVDTFSDPALISRVVSQALSECSKKGKVFLIYEALNTSIDECGEDILAEIAYWSKIALAFDSVLCFLYTDWGYTANISETISNLFPNIIDLKTLERIVANQVLSVSKIEGKPVTKNVIPIKKVTPGGIMGYIPKILITGPFHAGKTTIVHTLSSRAVSVQRMGTTVSLDFGHAEHRGFKLDLFGTVGQQRFDPILEQLGGEALGAILVVDSTKPQEFPRAKEMMHKAGVYGLPYVIVANKQDMPRALSVEEVRKRMNISDDVVIVGTVGSDKPSVLKALDALIDRLVLM